MENIPSPLQQQRQIIELRVELAKVSIQRDQLLLQAIDTQIAAEQSNQLTQSEA